MTTAKIEAVRATKEIDHLVRIINRYSGPLMNYQHEMIIDSMPVIFDDSKSIEEQKMPHYQFGVHLMTHKGLIFAVGHGLRICLEGFPSRHFQRY